MSFYAERQSIKPPFLHSHGSDTRWSRELLARPSPWPTTQQISVLNSYSLSLFLTGSALGLCLWNTFLPSDTCVYTQVKCGNIVLLAHRGILDFLNEKYQTITYENVYFLFLLKIHPIWLPWLPQNNNKVKLGVAQAWGFSLFHHNLSASILPLFSGYVSEPGGNWIIIRHTPLFF